MEGQVATDNAPNRKALGPRKDPKPYRSDNYWLRRKVRCGLMEPIPEHLFWRTTKWPTGLLASGNGRKVSVQGRVVHVFVARAQRDPGILARANFDVPFRMRVLVTEGPYTGNEVICFVPDEMCPHLNPTMSDMENWQVQITGKIERNNGFWHVGWIDNPTVERLDAPPPQDW